MRIKYSYLIIASCLFLLGSRRVNGQSARALGLSVATGLDLVNFVDDAFSPGLMNGQLHYNELGLSYRTSKLKMNAELGYAYGKLPTPYRFNHTARGNIDAQWQIFQKENISGFLGLSASSLTQFRRVGGLSALNLTLLYESTVGIGPSFSLEYTARNQDAFELGVRLPLGAFYIDRPYELIDNYAIDGENRPSINESWRFSGIGPIFHINMRMHYHIYINTRNRLSLIYNWEYNQQNVVPINRFRGAHHVFMLQYNHFFTLKESTND